MNITASTLGQDNKVINTREWTFERKSGVPSGVLKGCVSEGEAVVDDLEQKVVKEWLVGLKTAEKTDQAAKVALKLNWTTKSWGKGYALDLSEQSAQPWVKRQTLIDDEDDAKIEFQILGESPAEPQADTVKSSNKGPFGKCKEDLRHLLRNAVSFELKVKADAFSSTNVLIDSKEWTYKRPT